MRPAKPESPGAIGRTRAAAALGSAALLTSAALAGCASGGSTVAAVGAVGAVHDPVASGVAASTSAAASPDPASGPIRPGPPSALPASVWIAPAQAPLDAAYNWQAVGPIALAAAAPTFEFEQLCQTTRPTPTAAEGKVFISAVATLDSGPGSTDGAAGTGGAAGANGSAAAADASAAAAETAALPHGADWTAQESIAHDPSIDSAADQVAFGTFTDLTRELESCAQVIAGAQVTVSTDSGQEFAATVTIPTATGATATLHDYLLVPDGTVVELAFWVTPGAGGQPVTAWTDVPDSAVFAALKAPVCGTYHDC